MADPRTQWDDVRRALDELEPKVRFSDADTRDRWSALQPRLAEIQLLLSRSGEHARKLATRKLTTVKATLQRLCDDIAYAHC